MGLIRLGALWEKDFKNGAGFAGQLDAEEVEKMLKDDPQADKIRLLVFDNAKGLEKNENAPQFVIYAPDGEDDARPAQRGSPRPGPAEPAAAREAEPSNPLDDPTPPPARRTAAPARTAAAPVARGNGRRSTGGAGKRGYAGRRSSQ